MPTDFSKPTPLDRVSVVFGAPGRVFDLMPAWDAIPDNFRGMNNPWSKTAQEWFCRGVKGWPYNPKPGIDHRAAMSHLGAVLASFESEHEHKIAAAGYLMSLWYEPSRAVPHKATMKPRPKARAAQQAAVRLPSDRPAVLAGGIGKTPGKQGGLFG